MSEWQYLTIDLKDPPPGTAVIDALNSGGKEGRELLAIVLNHIAYLRPDRKAGRTIFPLCPTTR